ncbi:hypothetical protein B0H10DRAFT_2185835 [Mycena sp. CBHHK59/15]|nr:hypothetical protein B0H10DRAFT_2185835 [Mycena sp. CBHHK59/15]
MAAGKPPTSNLLPSEERIRMIRSTRKLGAMMGTTPLIDDCSSDAYGPSQQLRVLPLGSGRAAAMEILLPVLKEKTSRHGHRSSKREGVIFTVSSHSSISSMDWMTEDPESPPRVAKLFLSPQPLNSLDATTRLRLVLTLTQPTSSAGAYPSNHAHHSNDSIDVLTRSLSVLISALQPADAEHAERRKRMVKLTQMLGGPIPPSLVFPLPQGPHSHLRHARRRSRSVPPVSTSSAPHKLRGPHISPPASGSVCSSADRGGQEPTVYWDFCDQFFAWKGPRALGDATLLQPQKKVPGVQLAIYIAMHVGLSLP